MKKKAKSGGEIYCLKHTGTSCYGNSYKKGRVADFEKLRRLEQYEMAYEAEMIKARSEDRKNKKLAQSPNNPNNSRNQQKGRLIDDDDDDEDVVSHSKESAKKLVSISTLAKKRRVIMEDESDDA